MGGDASLDTPNEDYYLSHWSRVYREDPSQLDREWHCGYSEALAAVLPFVNRAAAGAARRDDAGAASTASKGASPFAQSASANPFGEASATRSKPKAAAEEDTRNAWEKLPKPAMAQVVIVLSFTTIISLMLATFWVVVQVRSIRDRVAYAQTESALFLSDPVTFFFSSLFTTRR